MKVKHNKIKLDDAFEEYVFQKKIGGERERTIKDHIKHLNYFKEYFKRLKKDIIYLEQIDKKLCQNYILYMMEEKVLWDDHKHIKSDKKGLSPSTINIRTNSLKAQFNFYVTEGYIQDTPWRGIKKLEVDETDTKFLNEKDFSLLLKAPDRKTYHGFRDYCLLNILIDKGPRITETIDLTLDDINLDELYIKFPAPSTKDREFRIVPISKRLGFLLKQLIKLNAEINDEAFHIFLSSKTGKKLDVSGFRENLSKYSKKAGLKESVTPHQLRHTFCVNYLRKGGDTRSMMEFTGHSTPQAAEKYTRFETSILREKMDKHSPLSQWDK